VDLVKKLPKVDLHYHLSGGLRLSTIKEIALSEGIELPATEHQLQTLLQAPENCTSLSEYLTKFKLPSLCLQTSANLKRAAYEAVEDMTKDNVKYLEIRFAPQLHIEKGLLLENVVSSVIEGMKEGERNFGIVARLILICLRDHDIKRNMEILELTRKFLGKGVVGIDLAGDEATFPPHMHKSVFEKAHELGIPITLHAGEGAGAESIREAVSGLFAQRIGHGVKLKENEEVFRLVKEKKIPLEMCLTSNIQTKAASSWQAHPIKEYYDQGIIVTVNTDNTTVSNTTLTKEYEIMIHQYGFTLHDLKKLSIGALQVSFLEDQEKELLLSKFHSEFNRLGIT
jgi:adenosine deaminase